MSLRRAEHPDPVSLNATPATLLPNGRGLEVTYPGFILHCEDIEAILGRPHASGFFFSADTSFDEFHHVVWADGTALHGRTNRSNDPLASWSLALILCQPQPGCDFEIALLVETRVVDETTLFSRKRQSTSSAVNIRNRVHIKRETSEVRIASARAAILNVDRHRYREYAIIGEVLNKDQNWQADAHSDFGNMHSYW